MNNTFDPFEEPRAPIRGNRSQVTGRPRSRFSPKTMFFAVMIALGILFGAVWSLYPRGDSDDVYSKNVPIVRADSRPIKVIPEDAGGMDIPHRDSTVFSALRPDKEERPRIENLLANDDEEPLPRSQLFAGLNTEDDKNKSEEVEIKRPEKVIPFEESANKNKSLTGEVNDKPVEKIIDKVAQTKTIAKEIPKVSITKPTTPTAKPKPKLDSNKKLNDVVSNVIGDAANTSISKSSVSPGDYYVQLASVKTRLAAESEWAKLKGKYNLSSSYRIQKKDLGAKGVFYRIQSGPYSKDKAGSICSVIKQKTPGGCLVTK